MKQPGFNGKQKVVLSWLTWYTWRYIRNIFRMVCSLYAYISEGMGVNLSQLARWKLSCGFVLEFWNKY